MWIRAARGPRLCAPLPPSRARALLPPPPPLSLLTSHDGGTVSFGTSRSAAPALVYQLYIVIYFPSQLFLHVPAMTRWIPTKKEKYGVGKCFSAARCVGLVESYTKFNGKHKLLRLGGCWSRAEQSRASRAC